MKKQILLACFAGVLGACNTGGSNADNDNNRDSITANSDGSSTPTSNANDTAAQANASRPATMGTDSAAVDFLKEAADGGMTEVQNGQMAKDKADNESVKRFGAMMVDDHSAANSRVEALAQQRNITLPKEISAKHQKMLKEMEKFNGKDFDRHYIAMMVDDHKKDISMFEKAADKTKDDDVKNFIRETLPKLKMHLDSATAIQKRIRK
jgi:putative membrane protein